MTPGDLTSILRRLLAPLGVLFALVLLPRECEIAAGLIVLVAAGQVGSKWVYAPSDSQFGRWCALWVAAFLGGIGLALLARGFLSATFFAAGYASASLLALAALTGRPIWGCAPETPANRRTMALWGLLAGLYATAGALGWEPGAELELRSLVVVPAVVAVAMSAVFTAAVGTAVWLYGPDRRDGWVRNSLTKAVAIGMYVLAGVILFAGLTVLPRLLG